MDDQTSSDTTTTTISPEASTGVSRDELVAVAEAAMRGETQDTAPT